MTGLLPLSLDPHAGIHELASYGDELVEQCDVIVVGSGPGGAVVAKELAEAGRDVVLVEEGPPCGPADFDLEPGRGMARWFREGSTRASRGNLLAPTMQAIALGGGSVFNSAICVRPPAWAFDKWAERYGVDSLSLASLAPHFERVESALGIAPTPDDVQGQRNLRFKQGCDALGWSSEPTARNVIGCRGSAECFSGCRNHAKRSVDVTYVPAALRAGARVYCSVRAEQLVVRGRRAVGVQGHLVEPFTLREQGRARFEAKLVVLAAGCMATPLILLRSGVGNSAGHVGEHLQLHPGLAVMAIYPEPIAPWQGATQGYHSLEFLREGLKLEVLWVPPGLLATRLPGVGEAYQQHLLRFSHLAPFDVFAVTEHSPGRVRPRRGSANPDIRFHLDARDVTRLARGVELLGELCWASGAEAILPGIHGLPAIVARGGGDALRAVGRMRAADPIVAANHAFGTARMSRRPTDGVVDESGRCHDLDNVYVADTSIFPDSPAVNPMHTCMALADRIAHGILARG